MPFEQSFEIIKELLGEKILKEALDTNKIYPSKLQQKKDTKWCQTIKIIGAKGCWVLPPSLFPWCVSVLLV